jgi:hypothetical protein
MAADGCPKTHEALKGTEHARAATFCFRRVCSETPADFDVSDVVVGAKRIPTTYLYAAGKWSDADEKESAMSVQIQCYKQLDF